MGLSHGGARPHGARLDGVRDVIVVDDHRSVADLLRLGIDAEPDLRCVGVAYDVDHGLALSAALQPDLVVTDLHFGRDEGAGLQLARRLTADHPDVLVLLLTGNPGSVTMEDFASSGACGLVTKNGDLEALLAAIRHARPDEVTIDPQLLRSLTRPPTPSPVKLSPRELDVLRRLDQGLDVAAVARQLGIGESTCRSYVKSLLLKLDVHSQLAAVAAARRLGLLEADRAR